MKNKKKKETRKRRENIIEEEWYKRESVLQPMTVGLKRKRREGSRQANNTLFILSTEHFIEY